MTQSICKGTSFDKNLPHEKFSKKRDLSQFVPSDFRSISTTERKKTFTIDTMGRELTLIVFAYLDPSTLNTCSEDPSLKRFIESSSLWKDFEMTAYFPKVNFFTIHDWTQHFNYEEDLTHQIDYLSTKRSLCLALDKVYHAPIEDNLGLTVLTIPKGLNLTVLSKISNSFNLVDRQYFTHVFRYALDKIGCVPVEETYTIIISNGIVEGSRGMQVQEQDNIVSQYGCRATRLFESLVLLVTSLATHKQCITNGEFSYLRRGSASSGSNVVIGRCKAFTNASCFVGIPDTDTDGVGLVFDKFENPKRVAGITKRRKTT